MDTDLLDQARQLSLHDQLELVEALWDTIAKRKAASPPTDAQKAELDRPLADHNLATEPDRLADVLFTDKRNDCR